MKKYLFTIMTIILCFTGCVSSGRQNVTASYTCVDVIIGPGTKWELVGVLTLPETVMPSGGYPAVVIVHGSGPGDMNGTAFAYKPYLDIADFLSSNGIAVLRYN